MGLGSESRHFDGGSVGGEPGVNELEVNEPELTSLRVKEDGNHAEVITYVDRCRDVIVAGTELRRSSDEGK
jgi:hypothetical protein